MSIDAIAVARLGTAALTLLVWATLLALNFHAGYASRPDSPTMRRAIAIAGTCASVALLGGAVNQFTGGEWPPADILRAAYFGVTAIFLIVGLTVLSARGRDPNGPT